MTDSFHFHFFPRETTLLVQQFIFARIFLLLIQFIFSVSQVSSSLFHLLQFSSGVSRLRREAAGDVCGALGLVVDLRTLNSASAADSSRSDASGRNSCGTSYLPTQTFPVSGPKLLGIVHTQIKTPSSRSSSRLVVGRLDGGVFVATRQMILRLHMALLPFLVHPECCLERSLRRQARPPAEFCLFPRLHPLP